MYGWPGGGFSCSRNFKTDDDEEVFFEMEL